MRKMDEIFQKTFMLDLSKILKLTLQMKKQ